MHRFQLNRTVQRRNRTAQIVKTTALTSLPSTQALFDRMRRRRASHAEGNKYRVHIHLRYHQSHR